MKRRKRLTAKQRKYFAPRTHRVKRRKRLSMARGRFRHYGRKAYGGLGGKAMFAPILGGLADHVLGNYVANINGIGSTAVGVFMHSPTTRDIGLYQLGHSIGNFLPLPGGSGTSGGLL